MLLCSINTVFLPCMHLGICSGCAHSLRMRNNPCPFWISDIEELLILESEEEALKKEDNSNSSTSGNNSEYNLLISNN